MDTPMDERRLFDHVTCNIAASVDEVTVPGALAIDIIEQVNIFVYFHLESCYFHNTFVLVHTLHF